MLYNSHVTAWTFQQQISWHVKSNQIEMKVISVHVSTFAWKHSACSVQMLHWPSPLCALVLEQLWTMISPRNCMWHLVHKLFHVSLVYVVSVGKLLWVMTRVWNRVTMEQGHTPQGNSLWIQGPTDHRTTLTVSWTAEYHFSFPLQN